MKRKSINNSILIVLSVILLTNIPISAYATIVTEEAVGKEVDEIIDKEVIEEVVVEDTGEIENGRKSIIEKNNDKSNTYKSKYFPVEESVNVKLNGVNYDLPVRSRMIVNLNTDDENGSRFFMKGDNNTWRNSNLKPTTAVNFTVKHVYRDSDGSGKVIHEAKRTYTSQRGWTHQISALVIGELEGANSIYNSLGYENRNVKVEKKTIDNDLGHRIVQSGPLDVENFIIATVKEGTTFTFYYEEGEPAKSNYTVNYKDADDVDNDRTLKTVRKPLPDNGKITHKDLGLEDEIGYYLDKSNENNHKEYLLVTNIDKPNLVENTSNGKEINLYFKEIKRNSFKRGFSIRYENDEGKELADRYVGTEFITNDININLYSEGLFVDEKTYFPVDSTKNLVNVGYGEDIFTHVVSMKEKNDLYRYTVRYIEEETRKEIRPSFSANTTDEYISPKRYENGLYDENGNLYKPVQVPPEDKEFKLEKNKNNDIVIEYRKVESSTGSGGGSSLNDEKPKEDKVVDMEVEELIDDMVDDNKPSQNSSNSSIGKNTIKRTTGYIEGYKDNTIRPENNVTREESAIMIDRIMELGDSDNLDELSFIDLDEDRWSCKSINGLVKNGYIDGYKDGTFKPLSELTRGEAAKLLFNISELDKSTKDNFKDLNDHWAKEYINALNEEDIILGYGDDTFRPNNKVTRAEFITMLNKLLDNDKEEVKNIQEFKDLPKDKWYYKEIQLAVGKNI